jgi:hypothetical protein
VKLEFESGMHLFTRIIILGWKVKMICLINPFEENIKVMNMGHLSD